MLRQKELLITVTAVLILLPYLAMLFAEGDNPQVNSAISIFDERNYSEAKEAFEKIIKENPNSHLSYYYLGRTERKLGNWERAVELLKKATELAPDKTQYFRYLALSYFSGARDAGLFRKPSLAKKGKEAMIKAVEMDPNNFDARFVLIAFYIEAPGLFGGDDDRALEQAKEVRKRDEVQGYKAFSIYYSLQEEWEKAEEELLRGLKKHPDNLTLLEMLGSLYRRTDRHEKALEIFDKILKDDPQNVYLHYTVGSLLIEMEREPQRAAKLLNKFLDMYRAKDRLSSRAYFKLGEIYRKQNKKTMAISMYQKALQINPDNDDAEDALDDLED